MPSEDNYQPSTDSPSPALHQTQTKLCLSCHATILLPDLDPPVSCPNCRQQIQLRAAHFLPEPRRPVDQDLPALPRDVLTALRTTRHPPDTPSLDSPPASPLTHSPPLTAPPGSSKTPVTTFLPSADRSTSARLDSSLSTTSSSTDIVPHSTVPVRHQLNRSESTVQKSQLSSTKIFAPDPLVDITRIRIRTRAHHCLYPGAMFHGTQKSGRNSYEVTVTIVNVDFATSFLCGYLCIRGLTDDWPELTTYFDAEIIGSRHGFLTQNWGATENEDIVHWSRFPAFRHIKHEAKRPRLTIDDRDRGAVFMRWKERFLVPDHRVQDINGASFAGFYYVCVDFNPTTSGAPSNNVTSYHSNAEEDCGQDDQRGGRKMDQRRSRRTSSTRRGAQGGLGRSPSLAPYSIPVATMNGFYYHQNSEPYQQLSLTHVPETFSSSFEFR